MMWCVCVGGVIVGGGMGLLQMWGLRREGM